MEHFENMYGNKEIFKGYEYVQAGGDTAKIYQMEFRKTTPPEKGQKIKRWIAGVTRARDFKPLVKFSTSYDDAKKWMLKQTSEGNQPLSKLEIENWIRDFMWGEDIRLKSTKTISVTYPKKPKAEQPISVQLPISSHIPEGLYTIIAKHSGKALDVKDGSKKNFANVQQYTYKGYRSHIWKISEVAPGIYSIMALHSGKVLDVKDGSKKDFANVQQYSYTGYRNQRWVITEVEPGHYSIIATHSGKALDVKDGSKKDFANVQQYKITGYSGQLWKLVHVEPPATTSPTQPPVTPPVYYPPTQPQLQQTKCFIATATFGTSMMHEINVLRNFRDQSLEPNFIGKKLINIYYSISPYIAKLIIKKEKLRAFTRFMLNPIVNVFKR